ncbi:hypothetical protein D3C86_865990 [compost metagenome]
MLNSFAHLGYEHNSEAVSDIYHCMPIIVGLGLIILALAVTVGYLLTTRQPKNRSKPTTKNKK